MTSLELSKMRDHSPYKKDFEYWNPLVSYQQSHSTIGFYYEEWCEYFADIILFGKEDHLSLMNKKEFEFYNSLPDESIKVYRGIAVNNLDDVKEDFGFSWTLDKNIAKWFAERYLNENDKLIPVVFEREISKDEIIWVLLERNEKEVVICNLDQMSEE